MVNHHLLLADLALKDEGFGDLLPGADAVILDEAHQVPDIAAQFFGQTWSLRQAQILLRDASAEMSAAGVRAPAAAQRHCRRARRCSRSCAQASARAARTLRLGEPAGCVRGRVAAARGGHRRPRGAARGSGGGRRHRQLRAARGRPRSNRSASLRGSPDELGLRWVEASAGGLTLQFTPFEIADRLREFVEARPCAWVFTSATLAIGEDFAHFASAHRPAAGPHPARSTVRSTIARRRAFICRAAMPDPQHPAFAGRFIDACAPLIEASGGRAFLLYTSYRGLAEGVAALKARFPEPPFPVLVQGEAPREALLNRFRELGNAVLLATGSFWEGVDVKGEALSIVAIDKLPFASPDDPLLKARLEGIRRRGGNPFIEYQLPQAVLALKQGVGRLIRDFEDFGVIVLGDPRLTSKPYGARFCSRCRRVR